MFGIEIGTAMSLQLDLLSKLECGEMIVSYIGLCINLFLIYLIKKHTIKTITPYKPILYQNCATDFIYTISTIIVRPLIDVQNGTAFFFVRTFIPYESPYVTKFFAIWYDDFALMLYIAVVPVQFLYRYIFIVKRIPVTRKLHAFMLSVAVSCCAFNASLFYMTIKDCHKNMIDGMKILSADPAYNSENAKRFVFSNTHNIYLFLFFGTFLLLTFISGLIIIFTSHAVWKNTRNLKSTVARDAHDQMTRILLLQWLVVTATEIKRLSTFTIEVTMTRTMSQQSDLLLHLERAEMIASYVGLCVNVLLVYLIKHHTIKNITPYIPILYQNCATDFIYAISAIIVRPLIDVQSGTAFFFVQTIIPYESPYVTKFLAIWFDDFALMLYIAVVPVQFIYRYIFIVKRTPVTRKRHALMLSVAVLCCAFNASLFYMTVKDCHKNINEGLKILSADPAYNSENAKQFVFSNTHNIFLFLFFGTFLLLTIVSGIIIIFTSHAVWKNTRNLKSAVARDAHEQMTRILLLQVGIPVFLCFIPVSFFIINTVLYAGPSLIPKMVLPVVSIFPIVNAILVIYFMKSYRNFFLSKLRRLRAFIIKTPPETVYSSSNKSLPPRSTS